MLLFFLHSVRCWGPCFHRKVAADFIDTVRRNLSYSDRDAFLMGAIYADGINKSFSHHIDEVAPLLANEDALQPGFRWFLWGLIAHIITDTFAHAGQPESFIVGSGARHHASEFIVDSVSQRMESTLFVSLRQDIVDGLDQHGIARLWYFPIAFLGDSILTHLPFDRFLKNIENDRCQHSTHELAKCNFMNHYRAMLSSLQRLFGCFNIEHVTDLDVWEVTFEELIAIQCCHCVEREPRDIMDDLLVPFGSNL